MLLLLLACSSPVTTQSTVPPPSAVPSAVVSDESKPHSHEGKHGGSVQMAGNLHVEAVFAPSGLMVWFRDATEQPLDPSGFSGTAVVQGPAGVSTVNLAPMGNEHLHAEIPLELGKPAKAVVNLRVDGKPVALSFQTEAVGLSSHDHTSLHGGVVSMSGDYHVEYQGKDGEYRFYVSDAHRVAVTAGVSGTVEDGGKSIPLVFDAETGLLHAAGEGAGTRPVMLKARVGAQEVVLGFN